MECLKLELRSRVQIKSQILKSELNSNLKDRLSFVRLRKLI